MAQVSDFRRRVQIVCATLVLVVVAACTGISQDSDTVTLASAQVAVVVSSNTGESDPNPVGITEWVHANPDGEAANSTKESGSGAKVIYLTFDDGPTAAYMKRILDVLDEYDAKATFFQVGENATAHPELTRSVIERGHALGNHSWNHRDLRRLSRGRLNWQITRTSAVLERIAGRPITCLRPPYGAMNDRVRSTIRDKKLALMLWDIDPRDWKRPGSAAIARRIVSRADPGDVILMHDGGGNRSQSVRALRSILRSLSKRESEFKTLPGC